MRFWIFFLSQLLCFFFISNLSTLIVPDEDYFRVPSCTLNLISTFVYYTFVVVGADNADASYEDIKPSVQEHWYDEIKPPVQDDEFLEPISLVQDKRNDDTKLPVPHKRNDDTKPPVQDKRNDDTKPPVQDDLYIEPTPPVHH